MLLNNPEEFFLRDEAHRVEYAAPLRFSGRTKGMLVVGFDTPEDCTETVWRLVDAAAAGRAGRARRFALSICARCRKLFEP